MKSKLETSNTAFIPQWYPVSNFFLLVWKKCSKMRIVKLGFKKMFNFEKLVKKKVDTATQLSYGKQYISSNKEEYSPHFAIYFSRTFHLENVDGSAKSWKFGQWYSTNIDRIQHYQEETKAKMRPCWRRKESNNES
jgi:hypothetical protein